MRLQITTPLSVLVDEEGVRALRGEDETGSFGILPGHAAFMTSLTISVVSWTREDGTRRHCAIRGGVLTVTEGRAIAIATREGVPGDDLETLDRVVLARFQSERDAERTESAAHARLELNAIRQIMRYWRADGRRDAGRFT